MSGTAEPEGGGGGANGSDGGELTDHQYFRAIEEVFIALRGAPLLLSPKDWQTARDWHRRGIPLELVTRALEELFEKRREEGKESKVSSLRYCAPAVEAAWKEVRELSAAEAGRTGRGRGGALAADAERPTPGARLEALASALPEDLPGRDELVGKIRELAPEEGTEADPGAERRIEEALAALEREAVEELTAALSDDRRAELEASIDRSLQALSDRLPRDEAERARRRLLAQKVRRLHRLPTLSLFSPEAEPR